MTLAEELAKKVMDSSDYNCVEEESCSICAEFGKAVTAAINSAILFRA
jgi:hypothetical protein